MQQDAAFDPPWVHKVMLMKPDHDSLNVVLLAAAHGSLPVRSFSSGQHTSAPLA